MRQCVAEVSRFIEWTDFDLALAGHRRLGHRFTHSTASAMFLIFQLLARSSLQWAIIDGPVGAFEVLPATPRLGSSSTTSSAGVLFRRIVLLQIGSPSIWSSSAASAGAARCDDDRYRTTGPRDKEGDDADDGELDAESMDSWSSPPHLPSGNGAVRSTGR